MRRISKFGIVGAGTIALAVGLVSPAFADYAPSSSDVVGVGSDTVQNMMDFISDGDNAGDAGFNSTGAVNKVVSFDATPDANDRAGYLNGSTSAALKPLNPTVVLRAGSSPIQRPNGSGAGIAALLADTGAQEQISFVRASRAPKASEESTMVSNQGTQLHTVEISDDPLEIAYASASSNIPAGGLSVAQLTAIYSCTDTKWTQVGGTSGDTIIPLIPQSGSGTRTTFLADISVTTPGPCVQTVEENDPTSITGSSAPADTIAPFSTGRLNLYNNSYFKDPTVAFPGASGYLAPGIKTQPGCTAASGADECTGTAHRAASDGGNVYDDVRALYIIFRQKDVTSTTPFVTGSSLNWAKTLFVGTSSYVATFGQSDIAAAGGTPLYSDKGAGFTVG
jgi:ABC-type phosphate transport system substrate-binding protein